jgi:hypothetical protein
MISLSLLLSITAISYTVSDSSSTTTPAANTNTDNHANINASILASLKTLSSDDTATLMNGAATFTSISTEATNCSTNTGTNYSACSPSITTTSKGLCCNLSGNGVNMCYPVPKDSASAYQTIFNKVSLKLDCSSGYFSFTFMVLGLLAFMF